MSKYYSILIIEAVVIFLLIFSILYFVFKKPKAEGYIKKRKGLYSNFSPKTILYIVLSSAAITYFVSQFSSSGITATLCFIALLGLAPLMINNMIKRDKQEEVFADVILFCQNVAMILKQTHQVYYAIETAHRDLKTSLADDIKGLLIALEDGRETTLEAMEVLETNYPYSCIRNLDVIILHMFFENANVNDELLITYQDDVTRLEQDVRRNKLKRKSLRMAYIIITAGSVIAYWFFVTNLRETFADIFQSNIFKIANLVYVFATMFSFFFVDRYFNLNTTKE